MKWISVADRMPPPGERVLVCNGGTFVCESYLSNGAKGLDWFRAGYSLQKLFGIKVSFWMPMPEPPDEN